MKWRMTQASEGKQRVVENPLYVTTFPLFYSWRVSKINSTWNVAIESFRKYLGGIPADYLEKCTPSQTQEAENFCLLIDEAHNITEIFDGCQRLVFEGPSQQQKVHTDTSHKIVEFVDKTPRTGLTVFGEKQGRWHSVDLVFRTNALDVTQCDFSTSTWNKKPFCELTIRRLMFTQCKLRANFFALLEQMKEKIIAMNLSDAFVRPLRAGANEMAPPPDSRHDHMTS
ncbi:MAG: hypothetical protein V1809_07150 [Planctomycetota bacterium]